MEANNLQKSRKEKIPALIEKYQSLVDKIFQLVSQELPDFSDVEKEGVIISTAEQQKFFFIDERNKALDNANSIMFKINRLEIEMFAPELLAQEKEDSKEELSDDKKQNWTKKKASESK